MFEYHKIRNFGDYFLHLFFIFKLLFIITYFHLIFISKRINSIYNKIQKKE